MWVRLMDWMIADGQPPLPSAGTVLTGIGLRVRGEVTHARPTSPDGVVEVPGEQLHQNTYALTGRVGEPRDFAVDTGLAGSQHAGVEFVLTVGTDRYQVQTDGWARDMPPDTRVTVRGHLEVVGTYEWEAFGLEESRANWLVQTVAPAPRGDTMLDVVPASNG